MEVTGRTVTIGVSCRDAVGARALAAFGGSVQGEFISFPSVELLWTVLTPPRWELLIAMTGAGAMSFKGLSQRLNRDTKDVHDDIDALLNAGIVERTSRGIIFPFDAIHVDFTVGKAA